MMMAIIKGEISLELKGKAMEMASELQEENGEMIEGQEFLHQVEVGQVQDGVEEGIAGKEDLLTGLILPAGSDMTTEACHLLLKEWENGKLILCSMLVSDYNKITPYILLYYIQFIFYKRDDRYDGRGAGRYDGGYHDRYDRPHDMYNSGGGYRGRGGGKHEWKVALKNIQHRQINPPILGDTLIWKK